MKRVILFLILWSICICLPVQAKSGHERAMRLLYWNIQNGMWDGQKDDYMRFTDWVASQKPDICVWCEAQKLYITDTDKSEVESEEECLARWKQLAKRYGHQYVYLSAHRDNYPQLITSRYPMQVEKLIVGNEDTIVCHGASWYRMMLGRKALNLVSLHTWPHAQGYRVPKELIAQSRANNEGDKFRSKEMEYICKQTILSNAKVSAEMWAMMGDFNSVSRVDNSKYQLPENSTKFLVHDYIRSFTPYIDLIKELYPDSVISTTGGGARIDFMYVTPALRKNILDAEVVRDNYTTPIRNSQKISNFWHPSDHLPILVVFKNK